MYASIYALAVGTPFNMHVVRRKKTHSIEWVDSRSRFLASVCTLQDCPPFVRMELRVPGASDSFSTDGCIDTHLEDNLFIELQEILLLRPYIPHNAMLTANPHLYEISVCVDNFWSMGESGGNSGRVVRHGTVYVSGDAEALRRLRGEKDTRFTANGQRARRRGGERTNADTSGVRGLTHKLQGGIGIRRMRTKELKSSDDFGSRWVCIDYTATHMFHCSAEPRCVLRKGKQAPVMNPCCCNRSDLYLVRQRDNKHDTNAIAVVYQQSGRREVVGFVPRELASCLAPAMDIFAVMTDAEGIYTDTPTKGDARNRVWFRVDGRHAGDGGPDSYLVNDKLQAIPWWVADNSSAQGM
jgi:HIRAN domain